MAEETSLESRLKETNETRNYLLEEIKHDDLMSEKFEKTCKCWAFAFFSLNSYWLHFNFCICLISCYSCITSSAVGIKLCAITSWIKKYKSIKKKKKKNDKIVLIGKDKLNTIEVLISKALIDSYTSHNEFISVNNVLRE